MLRKYVPDESHVLDFTELGVALDLTTIEWLVAILDREERVQRNRMIPFVKVTWQYHDGDSATWEREDLMWSSYPHLFGKCDLFLHLPCIVHFPLQILHTFTLLLHIPLLVICAVLVSLHTP